MEINVKNIMNMMLAGLQSDLNVRGFTINKSKKEFRLNSKINKNRLIFKMYTYKMGARVEIEPKIYVINDEINKVYKKNTKIEGRPLLTIGNHLFEIREFIVNQKELHDGKESQYNWNVAKIDDVKKLIEVIPEYLYEVAIPYFINFNTIDKIDSLLNKYPNNLSIHAPFNPLKMNNGLIAAKLNNNPNYEELRKIYSEYMKICEKSYSDDFNQIVSYLSSLPPLEPQ